MAEKKELRALVLKDFEDFKQGQMLTEDQMVSVMSYLLDGESPIIKIPLDHDYIKIMTVEENAKELFQNIEFITIEAEADMIWFHTRTLDILQHARLCWLLENELPRHWEMAQNGVFTHFGQSSVTICMSMDAEDYWDGLEKAMRNAEWYADDLTKLFKTY